MTVIPDRRVFFVGDSFVAGVGDPEHRGWVGRLAARSHRDGVPITSYNLGVRRDTSGDVCRRWPSEVAARRAAGREERLVVSFGVNDTTVENGGCVRVEPARSIANLLTVADRASAVAPHCSWSVRRRSTIPRRTSGSQRSTRCSAQSPPRPGCRT
nr:GDSL-type esterase/lipase family protein [Pseudonocardia asaccharolytica]